MVQYWMIALLVALWCSFSDDWSAVNIAFAMCIAVIFNYSLAGVGVERSRVRFRPLAFIKLLGFASVELVVSSLSLAWDILTPTDYSMPCTIEVELDCVHNIEKMLLANLISITPGTLFIDMKKNDTVILVHCMYGQNPSEIKTFIKHQLEPRVMRVFSHDNDTI